MFYCTVINILWHCMVLNSDVPQFSLTWRSVLKISLCNNLLDSSPGVFPGQVLLIATSSWLFVRIYRYCMVSFLYTMWYYLQTSHKDALMSSTKKVGVSLRANGHTAPQSPRRQQPEHFARREGQVYRGDLAHTKFGGFFFFFLENPWREVTACACASCLLKRCCARM